ncbi:hypothetical protein HSBAA_29570 [Vreelandella sulfidaeris]|uniref:Uncharacterized protein n=1 Tax=Vreelandella sulfidaeris TaxID=115553 RepID=A0A455UAQ6_9GAMM|nr:hypothetical protein HSBAA_29570 [Halomonas sulfidaeris]
MITYAEVPDDRITSDYLGERYNIAEAKARVGIHDRFIQFTKHNAIDAPALFDEVWEFYRNVGVTSWQSRGGCRSMAPRSTTIQRMTPACGIWDHSARRAFPICQRASITMPRCK